MIQEKLKIVLNKTKYLAFVSKGAEAFGQRWLQNFAKWTLGLKRACKKAEGLSSWLMDAAESANGPPPPSPVL